MNSLSRQRIFVFLVPLLLAAPFLRRAYFVDDSYFVQIASWLKDHPMQPYDFTADDAGIGNHGWEANGFVRMVNPLAHHYFLAALLKLGGEREWFLRLGCTLLSSFSALFLFELARRWTTLPLVTTLLFSVTPAQWLTSYSLLIDSTMTFFALGAVYFYVRATEHDSVVALCSSGIFAGLAILSKYPAVFVLPLMVTWFAFRWKKLERRWRYFVPPAIGAAFLIGYSAWTAQLYGRPHILAASARMVHVFGWPKIISFFVFFSGSLIVPVLAWFVVPGHTRSVGALLALAMAGLCVSSLGGFTIAQSLLLGFWLLTGFLFLGAAAALRPDGVFPRDDFLAVWLFGFVVMMLLVMDWVAVRYYCLVGPAVVMIAVRLAEIKWGPLAGRRLVPLLAAVFVVSAALGYSDYRQAEPSRHIGAELRARGYTGGDRHFYLGDSFTMSYLRRDGWVPCFRDTTLQVGDLILAKEVTMPLVWFARRPVRVRELATFDYPSHFPIKVMDYAGSAGFYASVWGALPFTFSDGPWERFRLFEITAVNQNDA